jgi:hypothetical protein
MSKKKHAHTKQIRQQPQWKPIGMLPTLAQHIDGMLEADREQYETLLEARDKPYVLDDVTVSRVKQAFTRQRNDFWLFEEQLKRWQSGPLTEAQGREVARLVDQMKKIRENNAKVLKLAEELSKGTIEKQMAKSDEQVGMEWLLRMMEGKKGL